MIDLKKFIISDTEYLKVMPEPIGKDDCEICAKCDIDYVNEEKNIIIRFGYDHTSSFCYTIAESGFIQKIIEGKNTLNPNIGDLGFEWNQYFQGIIKDTDVDKYLFCTNSHKQIRPYFSSWIYNDKDGNIIFEITPFYPWHAETKKSHADFITYKQFMKNYKPTLKTIIQKKYITKWIDQAKELKKTLIDNLQHHNND
ncbi:MAG TPA: hypothetical protein VLG50_06090 [Candidatus Saccharimonadales bacterium]|nr:hypothetical protein [Candidatus Saccharimonadales bacterium]